jgi:hypothetical protein
LGTASGRSANGVVLDVDPERGVARTFGTQIDFGSGKA